MTKKSEIGIFSLIILFVGIIFVPIVSAEKLSGETSDNVIGISDSAPELKSIIEQIPQTDPSILNKMGENKAILRTHGKIPKITKGTEAHNWFNKLDSIRINLNANNQMKPYFYPHGPLEAYGTNADGYFWVIFDERYNAKNEDYDAILDLINKQAIKLNIENVPIVFSSGTPITPVSASISQVSTSSTNPYLVYHRPITGGIGDSVVSGSQASLGTIGFTAKRNSDSAKGYVLAGHVAWWTTGLSSYQPVYGSRNLAGTVSKLGLNTDAAFVPYSNVAAKMHIGGGTFVNVNGYYTGGISGMALTKSGSASGSVSGQYLGVLTGQNVLGHYMDRIELMSTTCYGGDSGGPVYYLYNGRYKIVGIISASGTVNGSPATIYIPCGEVMSKLGVTPLTA
jgi:streptogrisin B